MGDYIELVKNQFFSKDNMDFIIKIVTSKNIVVNSNQILFNSCNKIFNNFIHTLYTQKRNINPEAIEELLITLNKMTIDLIAEDSKNEHIQQSSQDVQQVQNIQYTQPSLHPQPLQPQLQPQLQLQPQPQPQPQPQLQPPQPYIKKDNIIEHQISSVKNVYESIYMYSEDCEYNNGIYKLTFNKLNVTKMKLVSFELSNDLYNITEHNNKLEVSEKSIKKNINIPIGCYNINDLLKTIEGSISDKFKNLNISIKYNEHKNRIYINSEIPFSFSFIENDNLFIPLRFMLGFDKKEYMNNNNYSSNNEPSINIYDNIYIKILTDDIFNTKTCKDFKFFERISFNHIDTFGRLITSSNLNNIIETDISNLSIELYYRHISHRKFYKVNERLKFIMQFDIEKYL
jgi:hypothetical protein